MREDRRWIMKCDIVVVSFQDTTSANYIHFAIKNETLK